MGVCVGDWDSTGGAGPSFFWVERFLGRNELALCNDWGFF